MLFFQGLAAEKAYYNLDVTITEALKNRREVNSKALLVGSTVNRPVGCIVGVFALHL